MSEDSVYCTFCSVNNTQRSKSSVPHSQHQILQICPVPYPCCRKHVKHIKNRSRSPESPCRCKNKSTSSCQNWAATLKTSSILSGSTDRQSENMNPTILRSSFTNIEKTSSCPDRTCSCLSKLSSKGTTKPMMRCSIKSHSTAQVYKPEGHSQIAQHIVFTDEIVSELKDEIEKVKSQLHEISHQNIDIKENFSPRSESDLSKLIAELKSENKYLKKELEYKKRNHIGAMKEVERARDVMSDYEKKVGLLHQQALKSSKVMKQSKERFCKCLKEKDNLIEELQKTNKEYQHCIGEHEYKYRELSTIYESLQGMYEQNIKKYGNLTENNKKFCECIGMLEKQLKASQHDAEMYTGQIKRLEHQLANFKCKTCKKMEAKVKKQKEKYESRLKEFEESENILRTQIMELTARIKDLDPNKLEELKNRLLEYEKCMIKCKELECECKQQSETILCNETRFEKEREELRQLVDELTTVVKQNKITLLQLSNINREQEVLLETQSVVLEEKDEKIKWAESTIEMMRTKSAELEHEVEDLRKTLSGPCTKESCCCLSKKLEETKTALHVEKDNQLVKEKIIEDQSETIFNLQLQIKEKITELIKAKEESSAAQDEISKINNDLLEKHNVLENELHEKENLIKKLKRLEYQKSQLTVEMKELERILQQYHQSFQCDEKQQNAVAKLQKQIEQQRREWEAQKENLCAQKEKAVSAAKFATQKLLDTIADFQTQVNTQRKVQNMLTRMLHEKEDELKTIKSKMVSINSITSGTETDVPMNEIYKRNDSDEANQGTNSSFYSFCSNCSKYTLKSSANYEKTDLKQLFNLLTRTDEEPMKDGVK